MRGYLIVGMLLAMGLVTGGGALAQEATGQPAADEPRVTLEAVNQSVQEVAAAITAQTGIQVAVTANTVKVLNGSLQDRTVEDAVKLLAEGAQASWVRAYILEKQPPEVPYTAEELLAMLGELRTYFWENLDDEQRRELFEQWRTRLVPEDEEQPAGEDGQGPQRGPRGFFFGFNVGLPGGAVYRPQPPEGQQEAGGPGGPGGRDFFMRYTDPVRNVLMPARFETITLDLEGASIDEALDEFTRQSGFLVLTAEELEGTVTVHLENAPLAEALDAIAAAAGVSWRPFYVLGQPRELTAEELAARQQEMEQRREAFFQRLWAEFWAMPPDERARWIQERVARYENVPPERRERLQRRAQRRLPRLMEYAASLSPEQRLEIKPYLQAVARAAGQ